MPIRFRCAYCSQLMSIATRKAGVVIRCTKCAGEIIVPVPDGQTMTEAADGPNAGQAFESDNFDVELEGTANATVPSTAAAPPAPTPSPAPRRAGVFISIAMLCVSVGIVILLLILMFVAGFFIGKLSNTASNDHGILNGAPLNVAGQRGAISV